MKTVGGDSFCRKKGPPDILSLEKMINYEIYMCVCIYSVNGTVYPCKKCFILILFFQLRSLDLSADNFPLGVQVFMVTTVKLSDV